MGIKFPVTMRKLWIWTRGMEHPMDEKNCSYFCVLIPMLWRSYLVNTEQVTHCELAVIWLQKNWPIWAHNSNTIHGRLYKYGVSIRVTEWLIKNLYKGRERLLWTSMNHFCYGFSCMGFRKGGFGEHERTFWRFTELTTENLDIISN